MDALRKAKIGGIVFGGAELSWESRRGQHYLQLHWHLATWTRNSNKLTRRLLKIFPPQKKHDRPVQVSKAYSHEFLGYVNKVIKLPELLRGNRKHLPLLLLALDRIEPLDLIILRGLRLGAQADGLVLRPVLPKKQ